MTHSASDIAKLLDLHGLAPSRALGQNFVIDPNTVRRIAELAGVGAGDLVVEIGAGLGSLTLALLETGARVVAVELDRYLLPVLRDVVESAMSTGGAQVIHADALDLDWSEVLGSSQAVLVANLPYNVGTQIVLDVLERAPQVTRLLVMMQREVAERMVAGPGSRTYGIPSVKIAYWGTAKLVGRVPPSVFLPRPKVESALVAIDRHADSERPASDLDRHQLFSVIDRAFGQRRKMLRRSLAPEFGPAVFEQASIPGEERPESLGIDAWARLVAAFVNQTS